MNGRRAAGVAAVATVALALVRFGVDVMMTRVTGNLEASATLPTVGSLGQTAVLYTQVADALVPLATMGVAVGIGLYLGRRVDVRYAHRDLLRAVATGSGAVVGLASLAALVANGVTDAFGVLFALVTALQLGATLTLPLLVGTLAGAALVAFEADDEAPVRPAAHDAAIEPAETRERATERENADLQSAD